MTPWVIMQVQLVSGESLWDTQGTSPPDVCSVIWILWCNCCRLSMHDSLGLLFVWLFLELVGGLFILFANFIELLHVLEEVWASLESNEKLGLLAITAVVRGLDSDGLGPDFLECGIIVSTQENRISHLSRVRERAKDLKLPICDPILWSVLSPKNKSSHKANLTISTSHFESSPDIIRSPLKFQVQICKLELKWCVWTVPLFFMERVDPQKVGRFTCDDGRRQNFSSLERTSILLVKWVKVN